MKIKELTPKQLAAYFDHSVLQPFNTMADYDKHIDECLRYGFFSAAVNSHIIPYYVKRLEGSGIPVGASIGFPFGQANIRGKVEEARAAIEEGAKELDYVLNISRLLHGDRDYIKDEMLRLVDLSHSKGIVLKVILENCYLEEKHKVMACEVAVETGIDYVKTSTGFGTGGAVAEDIKLMRSVVGDKVKVKASGAMRNLDITATMVELDVDRIGSAFSAIIMEAFIAAKEDGSL